jgi:flagellar P-ring protein precursor FlgI
MTRHAVLALLVAAATFAPSLAPEARGDRLKNLVEVEGVRGNPLVGYGLVVGLAGTGDDATSPAVRRPLAAMIKKLGVTINEAELKAKNVAAVVVTAELPPFARPGQQLDVTVSSTGTAKSLAGGTLIATPLFGADREVYAVAQGSMTVGGFIAEGGSGSSAKKNHVTAGRIPGGGDVERAAPGGLPAEEITLILRAADFTTALRIVDAVDGLLGAGSARADDPAAVKVKVPEARRGSVARMIAELEALEVIPDVEARVVIDERTGTIVIGGDARLGAAAIAHGGLTVRVEERTEVSQPNPVAGGQTVATPVSDVAVEEEGGRLVYTPGAPTVAELAAALDALGARPRDLVAIFQALRAAGALSAEVVVQ